MVFQNKPDSGLPSILALDPPIEPFHWEVEFPEVFDRENSGFDAIVGNPPFAGKNTIGNSNAPGYLDWLKQIHPTSHGNADLVAHFYRRAFDLVRKDGTLGLIATNTIGPRRYPGRPAYAGFARMGEKSTALGGASNGLERQRSL